MTFGPTQNSGGPNGPSFVVAIDGPAGAGKSTAAKALARRLGWRFLDTGAIYRTLALAALEAGIAVDDETGLAALIQTLRMSQDPDGRMKLDGRDVSAAIRTESVTRAASTISAHARVRAGLLEIQRAVAREGPLVCEGRDMGSTVFPRAELKVYLDADLGARSRRRHEELAAKGQVANLDEIAHQIRERDHRDQTRSAAPLRRVDDQIYLDTSDLDTEGVLARLQELVQMRRGVSPP